MSNYLMYLKEEGLFEGKDKLEIASEMRDSYMGTCHALSSEDLDWLEEHDMLEYFYDDMFLCDDCHWWSEIAYQVVDNRCDECAEDDE